MEDQTLQDLIEIENALNNKILSNNENSDLHVENQGFSDNKKTKSTHLEKAFSCSYCDKAFDRKDSLRTHERVHTGERPFSCSLCDKKFTVSSALKIHERIHINEKPFNCSICDKKFIPM